jgi:diazepam-binding inhibitor (GABA receptor modulating acyl-CoA-binding protein)
MNLTEQFEAAVKNSKDLSQKPSNETLLQLYEPSNPFDFVNKAKYNAWSDLKGKTKEAAMEEYIALVEKLQE